MLNLQEMNEGATGRICMVGGTEQFQRRVTSVGLTPGCRFEIVQNQKKCPILLYARNTLLALDRSDCKNISVEVVA